MSAANSTMPRPTRILVTGAAGYIGAHVARALAAAGHEPVVYDNLSRGHREALRWGQFVEGDVGDYDKMRQTVERHAIEAVIHLAGYIDVGESMREAAMYYENNVTASLVMLRALRDAGVGKFVFSSSAAVYGNAISVPIPETHELAPISVYGRGKRTIEDALALMQQEGTMNSSILRYFNAAGAAADGSLGEDHDPESHLIPRACLAALGKLPVLEIYGDDFATPDGTPLRDYIHVEDLAEAHLLAVGKLLEATGVGAVRHGDNPKAGVGASQHGDHPDAGVGASQHGDHPRLSGSHAPTPAAPAIFNIGTGRGHSVREVLESVTRVSGRKVPCRVVARRAGDPTVLVANPEAAHQHLGWRARITELDDITASAWAWHARDTL